MTCTCTTTIDGHWAPGEIVGKKRPANTSHWYGHDHVREPSSDWRWGGWISPERWCSGSWNLTSLALEWLHVLSPLPLLQLKSRPEPKYPTLPTLYEAVCFVRSTTSSYRIRDDVELDRINLQHYNKRHQHSDCRRHLPLLLFHRRCCSQTSSFIPIHISITPARVSPTAENHQANLICFDLAHNYPRPPRLDYQILQTLSNSSTSTLSLTLLFYLRTPSLYGGFSYVVDHSAQLDIPPSEPWKCPCPG
jgi:hypothetical protein